MGEPSHVLRLTLTDGGIVGKAVCLLPASDFNRPCTYYAASLYPCTKDERCAVVDCCDEVNLDEMLAEFEPVVVAEVPVAWHVERDGGGEHPQEHYILVTPAPPAVSPAPPTETETER